MGENTRFCKQAEPCVIPSAASDLLCGLRQPAHFCKASMSATCAPRAVPRMKGVGDLLTSSLSSVLHTAAAEGFLSTLSALLKTSAADLVHRMKFKLLA